MTDVFKDVLAFHEAFDLPRPVELVRKPDVDVVDLRVRLITEEVNDELIPALMQYKHSDDPEYIAEVADGIIDSIVVIVGTAVSFGIPFDVVWQEVHRSNMAKLGPDGKPIRRADGKVLKPEGWQPPDVRKVLDLDEDAGVTIDPGPQVFVGEGVLLRDLGDGNFSADIDPEYIKKMGVFPIDYPPFEEQTFILRGPAVIRAQQMNFLESLGWSLFFPSRDRVLVPDNGVPLTTQFRRVLR